jgi:hypothetical protein
MRRYVESRHAWTPRAWPLALGTGALCFVVGVWVAPGVWLEILIAVVGSSAVVWVRWAVWRRRHPIAPPDAYITELIRERRRAARWN